jgi:hypothetical protein
MALESNLNGSSTGKSLVLSKLEKNLAKRDQEMATGGRRLAPPTAAEVEGDCDGSCRWTNTPCGVEKTVVLG